MEAPSRDDIVKELRPELLIPEGTSEEERFQNEVLRPILKFQNDLLLCLTKNYFKRHHTPFNALKTSAQEMAIHQAAKQDPELRNALIYSIVGLFSIDDLMFYQEHRPELNKRIIQMAIQRVQSQIERLY